MSTENNVLILKMKGEINQIATTNFQRLEMSVRCRKEEDS